MSEYEDEDLNLDFDSDSSSEECDEPPVLTEDSSKDDWVDLLIELAGNAYDERYRVEILFDAYNRQEIKRLKPAVLASAERVFDQSLWRFINWYVDFDKRFINQSLLESSVTKEATRLFEAFSAHNDRASFENYLTEYFTENVGYGLEYRGFKAPTP